LILTLDIGNTQIFGGVYNESELVFQFRKYSQQQFSSDEMGIFLINVLKHNEIDPGSIEKISVCSVVPQINHHIRNACLKYFNMDPFFLKPGVKTGLKIKYRNPQEVGADRISNAIAGTNLFNKRNLIIIDFGTATTFCVINKEKEYLGGVILPGLNISMEALERNAAQLPKVEITELQSVIGRSTTESIQSGLYFGQLGMIKELKNRITKEAFNDEAPLIIGTGGFSSLYQNAGIFDEVIPELVLKGLLIAVNINSNGEK
jgi:type III pantothenate kinase